MASKFEIEQMHVPYFAPKTIDQSKVLKVFEKNERSETKGGNKDKTSLLYQYMDKLKQLPTSSSSLTSYYATTFRKLMKLSKDTPIQKKWDQGGNEEEPGNEVWASANKDGGNFVELIQILLDHFLTINHQQNDNNNNDDDQIGILLLALDLVKQLALTQTGLLRYYEMKLDTLGRCLESRLIENLLEKRSHPDPMVRKKN